MEVCTNRSREKFRELFNIGANQNDAGCSISLVALPGDFTT
jgi:hypothetical protein